METERAGALGHLGEAALSGLREWVAAGEARPAQVRTAAELLVSGIAA